MSPSPPPMDTAGAPTLEKPPSAGGPARPAPAPGGSADTADGGRARRFWSARRLPAAVVAAVLVAGIGLLLYDIAAVRAGRNAMAWRDTLADELATRPLDDVGVRVGAVAAALLGLWLLLLALTPGRRRLLPMHRRAAGVRPGLERSAAALVLRDRAMEVPGIRTARVRVRRRRVRVRAQAHFRELAAVREDLHSALDEGIGQLDLARRPRHSVRLRRAEKK